VELTFPPTGEEEVSRKSVSVFIQLSVHQNIVRLLSTTISGLNQESDIQHERVFCNQSCLTPSFRYGKALR